MKHDNREHAPLPPSASGRWYACPPAMAYVSELIRRKIIKKRVAGAAAERGTRIHQWGEQFIKWMLKGKSVSAVKGDRFEIAEARAYAEFCIEKFEEAKMLDPAAVCGVEDRAIVDKEYCWGSRDFWIYAADRLTIIDLKSGREPVNPDCSQLRIYSYDKVKELKPDEIELCIWQPNSDEGGPPAKSVVIPLKDFEGRRIEVRVEAAKAYFGASLPVMEANLRAGDHCTHCDALGVCPAAREHAKQISKGAFMPVTTTSKKIVVASGRPLPNPATFTVEQVSEILERAPLFYTWLEAVKVHALELMQKGKTVPGFKAVPKNTHYAWEKRYTATQIAKAAGLTKFDILETRLLSPSKIIAKANKSRKQKLESMRWRPFEVTIAKESDRRPAIPSTKISFQPVSLSEENDDA